MNNIIYKQIDLTYFIKSFSKEQTIIYFGIGTAFNTDDEYKREFTDENNQEYPISIREAVRKSDFRGYKILILVDPFYKNRQPEILINKKFINDNGFQFNKYRYDNCYKDERSKTIVIYFGIPIINEEDIVINELINYSNENMHILIFESQYTSVLRNYKFYRNNCEYINPDYTQIGFGLNTYTDKLSRVINMQYFGYTIYLYYDKKIGKHKILNFNPFIGIKNVSKLRGLIDGENFKKRYVQYIIYKFSRLEFLINTIFLLMQHTESNEDVKKNIFGIGDMTQPKDDYPYPFTMKDTIRTFLNGFFLGYESELFEYKYKYDIDMKKERDPSKLLIIFVRLFKCELRQLLKNVHYRDDEDIDIEGEIATEMTIFMTYIISILEKNGRIIRSDITKYVNENFIEQYIKLLEISDISKHEIMSVFNETLFISDIDFIYKRVIDDCKEINKLRGGNLCTINIHKVDCKKKGGYCTGDIFSVLYCNLIEWIFDYLFIKKHFNITKEHGRQSMITFEHINIYANVILSILKNREIIFRIFNKLYDINMINMQNNIESNVLIIDKENYERNPMKSIIPFNILCKICNEHNTFPIFVFKGSMEYIPECNEGIRMLYDYVAKKPEEIPSQEEYIKICDYMNKYITSYINPGPEPIFSLSFLRHTLLTDSVVGISIDDIFILLFRYFLEIRPEFTNLRFFCLTNDNFEEYDIEKVDLKYQKAVLYPYEQLRFKFIYIPNEIGMFNVPSFIINQYNPLVNNIIKKETLPDIDLRDGIDMTFLHNPSLIGNSPILQQEQKKIHEQSKQKRTRNPLVIIPPPP